MRSSLVTATLLVAACGSGGGGTGPSPLDTHVLSIGFELGPGLEDTRCRTAELPFDADRFVVGYRATLPEVSHHLIVYRAASRDRFDEPIPCQSFFDLADGGAMIAFSQSPEVAVEHPNGFGLRVAAGDVLRLELHAIDATEDVVWAEATIELSLADGGAAGLQEVGTVAWGTTEISLPPGETGRASTLFRAPDGEPFDVLALATHQHRLGTKAIVEVAASGDDEPTEPVYESRTWSEPPLVRFEEPLHVEYPSGLRLTCEWRNTTDDWVAFGLRATDEMCFGFGWYTPARGPWFTL